MSNGGGSVRRSAPMGACDTVAEQHLSLFSDGAMCADACAKRLPGEAVDSPRRLASIAAKRERSLARRLARLNNPEKARKDDLRRAKQRRVSALPPAQRKPVKAVEVPKLNAWDERRLWAKVRIGKPDECWPWTAATSGFGYGRFKIAGKLHSPHRLIYAMSVGAIANAEEHHGSVVMHACDNPACCNPAHLSLGRQLDNVADMAAKGRRRLPATALAPSLSGRTV